MDWLAAHSVAEAVLACVCDQLNQAAAELAGVGVTVDGCPSRACVAVPQVAWEHCDCGGELVVAVERVYATDDFPDEDRDTSPATCYPHALAADMVVRILRCACVSEDEAAPSCACRRDEARQVTVDMAAALRGVMCCFADDDRLWVFGGSAPIGPSGGCVGSETRFTVDLEVCPCPEDG